MQWWSIDFNTEYRVERKDNTEILKELEKLCLFKGESYGTY